jgi:hypothetical protein
MIPSQESAVKSWIINGVEGRKIEMKREFALDDRMGKAKFAKLVTAIANTPGGTGYFIIGVVDKRDRASDRLDDIVVGVTHDEDVYQRQIQQALTDFTNPVPLVRYQELYFPEVSRKIGVAIIERSLNKPHEISRDSGDVKQGIYIRRGAETFQANREDLLAMSGAGKEPVLIVDFTHPLGNEQLSQISNQTGAHIAEVVQPPVIPIHFDEDLSFEDQIRHVVDLVGITDEEWQETQILVNVPGYAPITAALIADIHGRMGHFPKIIRLKRTSSDSSRYELAELMQLQRVRDKARARRQSS